MSGKVLVNVKAAISKNGARNNDLEEDTTQDWSGELSNGKYFGEIALVMDSPRKATVTAQEQTILLVINARTFKQFFEGNPHALAEVQIRMLGEKADLLSVLMIQRSRMLFREFLETEHAEENMVFWEAVDVFEVKFKQGDQSMEQILKEESERSIPQYAEVSLLEDEHSRDEVRENGLQPPTYTIKLTHPIQFVWHLLRSAQAKILWEKYLKVGADLQVNISSKMRNNINKVLTPVGKWMDGEDVINNGTASRKELETSCEFLRSRTVMNDAKQEIYRLMVRDSYPRFKKSESFLNFIKDIGLYSETNTSEAEMNKLKNKEGGGGGARGKSMGGGMASKMVRGLANRAASSNALSGFNQKSTRLISGGNSSRADHRSFGKKM